MLSIFKKIFGKTEPKAIVAAVPRAVPAPQATPMPTIEVAHLSLAAIVARFPDEMKPLLNGEPDPAATVALPLPTILKQLMSGCVKMSLASLHRQAHGFIKPLPPGDKRTIDVPLGEVFRHLRPEVFRRREQRHIEIPETGFNLFGDSTNPYAISPDDVAEVDEPEPIVLDLTQDVAPEPVPVPDANTPRVLQMDDGLRAHFKNGAAGEGESHHPAEAAPTPVPRPVAPAAKPAIARPAAAKPAAPAPEPVVTRPQGPTLNLPITALSANWPEEIRTELAALDPATTVILPQQEVSAGLSKGRVSFTWRQIHAWLEPECATKSALPGDTVLQLPLKVVAPAYLSASKKPAAERKSFDLDESIPALFSDGRPPEEVPAATIATAEAPAPEPEAAPPAPAPAPELTHAPAPEPVHAAAEAHAPVETPAPEPEPVQKLPESVGEIFQQPQKQTWTPAEIVAGTVTLTGVAGAIVALQEGLVVSASLPEGVKSEVVAAFLPQIFARLNQYAGEMRLGDVDDLLFTTHGAHCQIYRLGYVYFAVLGKAGESLPWHELRIITEELARHTHK